VIRALEKVGKVEVVVLNNEDDYDEQSVLLTAENQSSCAYRLVPRSKKGLARKIRWILDPRIDYPHGCGLDDEAVKNTLMRINEFDVIWFFKLRTPNMFPYAAWARSVVDIDDVPSTYQRACFSKMRSLKEKFQAFKSLHSWKRRERVLGERFTVLSVCSEGDRQYLERLGVKTPVHLIPNGFEKPSVEPSRSPVAPPRIGFIGLYDYIANREGVEWFISECWPSIKREVPDARFRLVGQGSDGAFKPYAPDVDVMGFLKNPNDEIATWSAMIVPIRLGAGTRVKIAYGFGRKCPVISTSLGAFGYDPVDGRELYLADSAKGFADSCIKAIRQPEQASQMAERAWKLFLEKWTWDSIEPSIWAATEECMRLNARK
jgi:glycosyltransferase involved in cell wall biosynthesis